MPRPYLYQIRLECYQKRPERRLVAHRHEASGMGSGTGVLRLHFVSLRMRSVFNRIWYYTRGAIFQPSQKEPRSLISLTSWS